jgi:hypothetical protein
MDIAIPLSGHGESVHFAMTLLSFREESRYAYRAKAQIMLLSCSKVAQQLKHGILSIHHPSASDQRIHLTQKQSSVINFPFRGRLEKKVPPRLYASPNAW